MSLSRRAMIVAGAAAAIPVVCQLPAFAQPAGGARDAKANADAELATWMLADGFKQIEVSRPALQKAEDDAVKAFAQAEIKEHEDLKAKITAKGIRPLVPIGGEAAGANAAAADANNAAGVVSGRSVLQVKNEIAVQCMKNNTAEGARKQGKAFDDFYVNDQLSAHMTLKDTVEVALRHASPEMKPVLEEALATINTHLDTLKGLKQKMMDEAKRA